MGHRFRLGIRGELCPFFALFFHFYLLSFAVPTQVIFLHPTATRLPFSRPFGQPFRPRYRVRVSRSNISRSSAHDHISRRTMTGGLRQRMLHGMQAPSGRPNRRRRRGRTRSQPRRRLLPNIMLASVHRFVLVTFRCFSGIRRPQGVFLVQSIIVRGARGRGRRYSRGHGTRRQIRGTSRLQHARNLHRPLRHQRRRQGPKRHRRRRTGRRNPIANTVGGFNTRGRFQLARSSPPHRHPLPCSNRCQYDKGSAQRG